MREFTYYNPQNLIFGENAMEQLSTMELPGKKALIIVTPERFYVDRAQALLKKNGVDCVVFDEVRSNPNTDGVDRAAAIARKEGCDFVLSIGGGSSTDTAKAVAVAMKNDGPVWDYVDKPNEGFKEIRDVAPIVVVSTTSGTGTEADQFAVVANDKLGMKLHIWDMRLYPAVSIVDPVLQVSLPKMLTASTGMDVIFHASEVYLNKNNNAYTDLFAVKSLQLAKEYLVEAYQNGNNLEARGGMALASNMAGVCMSQIDTISLHAMAHTIGALHPSTPHGVALSVCAVEWFKYYAAQEPERLANLSDAVGYGKSPDGFVSFVEEFLKDLDLDNIDISKYGIDPDRSKEYAEHCLSVCAAYHGGDKNLMSVDQCAEIFKKSLKRS